ncbi:MAG TPA: TerB family tellurite resistance protein [Ghiorsea sp.]|nr:TerB family tellurite resistance protein [Ghiorsea sp.]HIP06715.1 TerB family tellurite resistance protein [Mariprofundaceae bacterium]
MFSKLKSLFNEKEEQKPEDKTHNISLAVTAVMIEIMNADDELDNNEHNAIFTAIEKRFDLSHEEVDALIVEAKAAQDKAMDLHQFTSLIIEHFSTEERIDILKELWLVAMADGKVDSYEEHMIRKLAKLIGVYHGEFIQAKIDARESSNLI